MLYAHCISCHAIKTKRIKPKIPYKGKMATTAQIALWKSLKGKTNESLITHGMAKTHFWGRFQALKARCENPKNNRYYIYGARGIKCEWKSFEEFRDDMYESYVVHVAAHGEKNTTIDRYPDSNGNYSKNNCRWATQLEQANNKRNTKYITYLNKTQSLSDWCRELNLPMKLIWSRLKKGWPFEKAISRDKFRNNMSPYESI